MSSDPTGSALHTPPWISHECPCAKRLSLAIFPLRVREAGRAAAPDGLTRPATWSHAADGAAGNGDLRCRIRRARNCAFQAMIFTACLFPFYVLAALLTNSAAILTDLLATFFDLWTDRLLAGAAPREQGACGQIRLRSRQAREPRGAPHRAAADHPRDHRQYGRHYALSVPRSR